jgi:hypothetical protein
MVFETAAHGSRRKTKLFCDIVDRNIFFSRHRCKSNWLSVKIRILKIFLQSVAVISKTILYLPHVVIRH